MYSVNDECYEKLLAKEEMFYTDYYINWLINYLELNHVVCNDDYFEPTNEIDRINIEKLGLFFEKIEKYLNDNYIFFEPGINGKYIHIYYNDVLIRVEEYNGCGGQIICSIETDTNVKCVDFCNILSNIPVNNQGMVNYLLRELYIIRSADVIDIENEQNAKNRLKDYIKEINNEQVYENCYRRSKNRD